MRKKVFLVVAVFLSLGFVFTVLAQDLVWENIGGENSDLRTVLVDFSEPPIIYIGSSRGVFKSEDEGKNWRNILSVRGQNKEINFLLFEPKDKNSLYAATGNGVFRSSEQGKNWNRIFQGKNYLEKECTSIAVLPNCIYLGTKNGLFVSKDKGRSWHRETIKLGNAHILAIAYKLKEPNYIYIACTDGVFKTKDAGQTWERIFITHSSESDNDIEEEPEEQGEEERTSSVRYLAIDPNNLNCLYLATSRGVYKSQDRGESWKLLTSYGLLSSDIKFLLIHSTAPNLALQGEVQKRRSVSTLSKPRALARGASNGLISDKSNIYAITKSGIFEYKDERWRELSFELVAGEIRFLTFDSQDNLYAACDKGLFRTNREFNSNGSKDNTISLYFKDEPEINRVQDAAIRYAEVEYNKIKEWRKKANMKAILPKLTVGLDNSKSTNYEIYTSATTRYVYDGPDDESHGWDVTLSWDLGDLIWNNDQTSIDVRSRLMVQLRQDILDEVTKLYFERIRVKSELDTLTIEDRRKRFEKELKIQELTAMLDGLTGGYFSSHSALAQN